MSREVCSPSRVLYKKMTGQNYRTTGYSGRINRVNKSFIAGAKRWTVFYDTDPQKWVGIQEKTKPFWPDAFRKRLWKHSGRVIIPVKHDRFKWRIPKEISTITGRECRLVDSVLFILDPGRWIFPTNSGAFQPGSSMQLLVIYWQQQLVFFFFFCVSS